METKDSHSADASPNVKPYKTYENDFTDPGDFAEETDDKEILLVSQIWPGRFNGKKWVKTANDSHEINIQYHNKFHVYLEFIEIYQTQDESLVTTCNFVKEAARLFFLRNSHIPGYNDTIGIIQKISPKLPYDTWDEIQQSIEKIKNNPVESDTNCASWYKTMTVEEAKELFAFLKIKVNFPS